MREAGWVCLEEVQQLLAQGKEGKARERALRYFANDYQDPELFYAWAKTFELLGMAKKAISAYGLAVKLSPDNPRYLKPLAILFYELGQLKEAFHSLKRLRELCPEDEEIKKCWTALLKELGFEGAYEKIKDVKEKPSPLRYFPPSLGKRELSLFLHLFAGRQQGLAEQVRDEKTGLSKLLFHDIPLNEDWIKSHLLGEKTLFFFPLREDKRIKQATLALFISKRDRFYYTRQPSFLELKAEALKEYALKVLKMINGGFALPAYLERVNRFFYRIWLFLEEFVHFLLIKRFLRDCV